MPYNASRVTRRFMRSVEIAGMTGGRSDEENDRGCSGRDYIVQLIVLRS